MPIETTTEIRIYDQEQFHALDHRVMRIVFDVHNEFDGLLDEDLYKTEIAARCLAIGLTPAEREVRIRVIHRDFTKDYLMDLLLCHGLMVEAKVADRLGPAHRGQALNYLLLAGMHHGRLVNLRGQRVEHEFVSTSLTATERHRVSVNQGNWVELSSLSKELRTRTIGLLDDWGAFLDVNLYREALVHFLKGSNTIRQEVEVFSGTRCVGTQKLHLLDAESGWTLTTRQDSSVAMGDHLRRLLNHTRLNGIHWINLNRHQLEFSTILR